VPRFRGFSVSVSIDGHGKLFRLPAARRQLAHAGRQSALVPPGTQPLASPRCRPAEQQRAGLVPALRFLDEHELALGYNVVSLAPRVSPDETFLERAPHRRHGCAAYLDAECRPAKRRRRFGLIAKFLEDAGDDFDAALFGRVH